MMVMSTVLVFDTVLFDTVYSEGRGEGNYLRPVASKAESRSPMIHDTITPLLFLREEYKNIRI
jgi:hypothetical protein